MTDPYSVLGIPRNASDEEIKKAYRSLSRKYHPDANINNPDKDKAEARFKDVQQAYQQIMREKEYGSSGYGQGSQGQGGSAVSVVLAATAPSGAFMANTGRQAPEAQKMKKTST